MPQIPVQILTADLLDTQCVGLGPRAKEACLEAGNQIEIMQFAIVLEHLDRSNLIRTAEEEDR